LWAMEQALRAGCCGAVLGWPMQADEHALRRLQVAAEAGQALAFAFRPLRARDNPSPAPLRLSQLHVLEAAPKDALWAMEQALRAGCCGAVLGWPMQADDHALRRLQVAAEAGQALAFAFRPLRARDNPSPAPLRLSLTSELRLLKCRGALPPAQPLAFHPFH